MLSSAVFGPEPEPYDEHEGIPYDSGEEEDEEGSFKGVDFSQLPGLDRSELDHSLNDSIEVEDPQSGRTVVINGTVEN